MVIHMPKPRPVAAGFWARNQTTGELHHVDAHPELGSAVTTLWPTMDRPTAYGIERAVDWILNAATESRRKLDRAFRAIYPGSRTEHPTLPSDWWEQQIGQLVAIEFSAFFGNAAATTADRSVAGLLIDDSTASQDITGFRRASGASGGNDNERADAGERGQGPGGGGTGGNGGHGRSGSGSKTATVDGNNGPVVNAEAALTALVTGTFNAGTLAMGGSGGGGNQNGAFTGGGYGGAGGAGRVVISSADIVVNQSLDLKGESGQGGIRDTGGDYSGGGGHGSGGGYYAISRMGFTLASGATIDLRNGKNHATRGNGRLTTFTVDQPTINGTVQGGVITHFQIYPSIPFGGLRVM